MKEREFVGGEELGRLVLKEVLPFMSRNNLCRCTACGSSTAAVCLLFHEQEVCEEREIDLLLVSGVRLLHDCSKQTWEFNAY